jgi:hypothetical protein
MVPPSVKNLLKHSQQRLIGRFPAESSRILPDDERMSKFSVLIDQCLGKFPWSFLRFFQLSGEVEGCGIAASPNIVMMP